MVPTRHEQREINNNRLNCSRPFNFCCLLLFLSYSVQAPVVDHAKRKRKIKAGFGADAGVKSGVG